VSWPHACITRFLSLTSLRCDGRQVVALLDRQCVHVGAQRDDRAGLAALQHRLDPGFRDAGLHLDAWHRAQRLGDVRRRLHFLEEKLRVLVDVAPPRDYARFDFVRERIDVRLRVRERMPRDQAARDDPVEAFSSPSSCRWYHKPWQPLILSRAGGSARR
jgi:hypothetical protein